MEPGYSGETIIMIGKLVFGIACCLFFASLFTATVTLGDATSLSGIQTFFSALRYGTAGLFSPSSVSAFIKHFVTLMSAAANFVFIFWAMLVFSPTRVTALKWFWWISLIFIVAAAYTGVLVTLDDRAALQSGYFFWLAALLLMFLAPVVARIERKRALSLARRNKGQVVVKLYESAVIRRLPFQNGFRGQILSDIVLFQTAVLLL